MKETLHIYTRVSSASQEEGTSLDTQKSLGIKKSKELGMQYKVWNEGAASSHHEDLYNRPKIREMLHEIESGNIKHVFVYNNDRLSRNDQTQFIIKNAIIKNGVILYTKDGTYDLNNPTDKLMKSLLDGVAEYDNAIRAERSRLGKLNKVRNGGWYGAPPPYGYEVVDGKLAIHPDESKTVKKIYKWFNDGKSVAEIKRTLDRDGVTARRGGLFNMGSINRLMQNTHHIGYYTYTDKKSGETVPCVCPPIVDETLWNNVQEIRKKIFERKGQNNRTQRFYLLRNLMYCGECGTQMSGRIHEKRNERLYFCSKKSRNWKGKSPTKDQRYKRGKVDDYGCDMNRSLNIPLTDEFVWNAVIKTVSQSSTLKERFKNEILHSKFATDDEITTELKNQKIKSKRLRGELGKIQTSIADVETNNLLQRYDAAVYEKIILNLTEESDKKKDEIEQTRLRIKELGKEKKWLDWIEKYADKVDQLTDYTNDEKKEYLEGIIDRIDVRLDKETLDHHLDVIFKLPLVGDDIKYIDETRKSAGYEVVDGDTNQPVTISHDVVRRMGAAARKSGRQKQNAQKKTFKSTYHLRTNKHHGGMNLELPMGTINYLLSTD